MGNKLSLSAWWKKKATMAASTRSSPAEFTPGTSEREDHIVQVYDSLLSDQDIADILQKGENDTTTVTLAESVCARLNREMAMALSPDHDVPLNRTVGNVLPHVDVEANDQPFAATYLFYLNDSSGSLVIGGTRYPIQKGRGYVFPEGLTHSVVDADDATRWMLGPMTAQGTRVGATPIQIAYVSAPGDDGTVFGTTQYSDDPRAYFADITVISHSAPQFIPTTAQNFLRGWYVFATSDNTNTMTYYKLGDVLFPGTPYPDSFSYWVYPVWGYPPVPPIVGPSLLAMSMKSLFTDNSQVYYKLHTAGGIGTTRNSSTKARKT
uniref:Uncharacterized protein n=1 Tax=viral metagenome TaxID=1070528 RepID=A0A6C0EL91_9ZZZZ